MPEIWESQLAQNQAELNRKSDEMVYLQKRYEQLENIKFVFLEMFDA